jgi:hypothetical protein
MNIPETEAPDLAFFEDRDDDFAGVANVKITYT